MVNTDFVRLKPSEIPVPFRHRYRSLIHSGTIHDASKVFSLCYEVSHHSTNGIEARNPQEDSEDELAIQETETNINLYGTLSDNPLAKQGMLIVEGPEKCSPLCDDFSEALFSMEKELADIIALEGNNNVCAPFPSDGWDGNHISSSDDHVNSDDFGLPGNKLVAAMQVNNEHPIHNSEDPNSSLDNDLGISKHVRIEGNKSPSKIFSLNTEEDATGHTESDVHKSHPAGDVSGCYFSPNSNEEAEEGEISKDSDFSKKLLLEGEINVRQEIEKHVGTNNYTSVCDKETNQTEVQMTDKEHVARMKLDVERVGHGKSLTEASSGKVGRYLVHYGDVGSPVADHCNPLLPFEVFKENAKDADVCKNKKRAKSTKEAKEKRKRKYRLKRAEKNRELGVKRLKLPPVPETKPITYCRHYLKGRCHKGDECNFSHDTVPLTKSSPCCHFARHTCMKGDDCPFDHELAKYPCNNFTSKGFCSRGGACLFSHKEGFQQSKVAPKSSNTEMVAPIEKKPNVKSTPQPPRGAKFLSLEKSTPPVELHPQEAITHTQLVKSSPIVPKGINFLSFGALHKDQTHALLDEKKEIVKCEDPQRAPCNFILRAQHGKSSSNGASTMLGHESASAKALFGYPLRDGQKGFGPSMASENLTSTLAFSAKYDSVAKMTPLIGYSSSSSSIGGTHTESVKATILDFLNGITNKSKE